MHVRLSGRLLNDEALVSGRGDLRHLLHDGADGHGYHQQAEHLRPGAHRGSGSQKGAHGADGRGGRNSGEGHSAEVSDQRGRSGLGGVRAQQRSKAGSR